MCSGDQSDHYNYRFSPGLMATQSPRSPGYEVGLVPTVLHLSAAKSEHFDFNIFKKLQMFVRVKENFALELKKNI